MRITNPNNTTSHFYAGKCKGNAAPKHVALIGEQKKVVLDKKKATMFDSPKSDYIYIKVGGDWLWVKDKAIFALDTLTPMAVTRTAKVIDENTAPDATDDLPSHTGQQ